MIKILKYFLILALIVPCACEMDDNLDPKHAYSASVETLFPTATEALAKQYSRLNVNLNFDRHLAQYVMDVTYIEASRFNFVSRKVSDGYWAEYYRDVLMDLNACMELINAEAPSQRINAQKAAVLILEAFTYTNLVETFGNVPYTDALNGDITTPKYDDAKAVYSAMFTKISDAIALLEAYEGNKFMNADLLFGGDAGKWLDFAYNYKFVMAMHMADVPDMGTATIVKDLASKLYDPAEKASFIYNGSFPYVNDIYTEFKYNRRRDYVASNTIIDRLQALNDPRIDLYFTPTSSGHIGKEFGKKVDAKKYNDYSHLHSDMMVANYPIELIDGVQIAFLLAEAAERGYDVPLTAEEYYNIGVENSILNWGGTNADVTNYMAQEAVAYATAAGDWKQKIGTQKWIALFNRGHEAWTEWRRLDQPSFNIPEEMTAADLPVRYPYPFDEDNMNPANYAEAAAAIGGDSPSTKLFWDKN